MASRGYRRRDLIERHTWRTGLSIGPEVAEAAALTICEGAPGDARDLLEMCGLVAPGGPAKVGVNICTPRPSLPRTERDLAIDW